MSLRRSLVAAALICAMAGAGMLTLALCCIAGLIGSHCELWLLGPLTAWPLGLGLGLIGRAMGRAAPGESATPWEADECGQHEET